MAILLELTDLSVAYGAIEAVRDVSLEVFDGEVVALLGSNGAGKTTTLRSVAGLHPPRNGNTRLRGEDITHLPAHRIVAKGLALVPEGRKIFGTLTVLENLTLGGYVDRRRPGVLASRREYVFSLFPRLEARRRQLGGTLSGGEQQMLAVGRALMAGPKLLAMDEPSLGLSPMLTQLILKTVRDIASTGVGVLMVEQNANAALRIADRAYVMEGGRIVLAGPADALAQDDRVRDAYLGGFTSMDGAVATT